MTGPYEILELSSEVSRINVGTGVHMVFPPGCFGMICDRSSTPIKLSGATTFGGTIDPFYTGEVKIHFHTHPSLLNTVIDAINLCFTNDIAVAQIIPVQYFVPQFIMAPVRPIISGRGDAGYGSTDKAVLPPPIPFNSAHEKDEKNETNG